MSTARRVRSVEEAVVAMHRLPGRWYWLGLALSGGAAAFGAFAYSILFREGLHRTGLMRPVGWGVMIVNFVFWVGIAHAGTLISAILYLFRARFRTAINRIAEMMTVFAVLTAGLFPILHLGRPWFAYWLAPLPNQRQLWVNFRSPLVWDLFAISIYLVVSSIFLLVGVIPDAAALRDRSTGGWRARLYAALAFGWRGTDEQWRHYTRAYLLFAALVTPLVVSVHSIVSWDFAVSIVPGWHSTIFPPYFVAGAILSGVAMVITVLVPLRRAYRLEDLITPRHLDRLARLVILTALIVAYCYATEILIALGAPADDPERSTLVARMTGPYAPLFWLAVSGSCLGPLLLLFGRVRGSVPALLAISLAVNVGMWLERFVIVVSSLSHGRLPFGWRLYTPSWVELALTLGSFGWFFFLLLVGLKLLPPLSVAELKEEAAHRSARAAPHVEEARHAG
jgi:molybdopterin-containing oxidoreductase family membrane subunit